MVEEIINYQKLRKVHSDMKFQILIILKNQKSSIEKLHEIYEIVK